MAGESTTPTITNLDELLEFRGITERISAYLSKRLKEHLATLWPLLAPGRVLGKHVGARDSAARADEALADLREKFKQASGGPFDFKPELDEEVLTSVGSGVQVFPYEYSHELQGAKAGRVLAMTSPVRWVATYTSDYSLAQVWSVVEGVGDRRSPAVRQFVANALMFQVVLNRNHAAAQLLKDLRWDIEVMSLPGLDRLPLVTFGFRLPSFRPPDDLLLTAVRLSGVPAFIELIEPEAVARIEDPLRRQIETLLREQA